MFTTKYLLIKTRKKNWKQPKRPVIRNQSIKLSLPDEIYAPT